MDGSRQVPTDRIGGRRATDPAPAAGAGAPRKMPLGQMLIARGLITEDQLRIALIEQGTRKQPVGKVLVALGFLSEAMLRDALAADLGAEQIDLTRVVPDGTALALIPREFANANLAFPVAYDAPARTLKVAVINPGDIVLLDRLRAQLPPDHHVVAILGAEGDISAAIQQHYEYTWSIDGILHEIETGEVDVESVEAGGRDYSGPVVRLIDSILADAVQRRASDLHFEPEAGFLRIRYRIDGVLRQIRAIHQKHWSSMLSRLKVVTGMNIAESRAPQDGRCTLTIYGRSVDFRAAVQPTVYGENFVLRILDRSAALVPLASLGFEPEQLELVETMISRPIGMLLVTGPTGSGKTTTLYSMLQRQNRVDVNIMTLEDPVEYPLPLVRQADLSTGIKMEFGSGIRSLMRQDPDIILLGEIRDGETATMALRAAMTGHQVFSTLHSNSAVGALARLFDLGLTPDLLAGNLVGIIGQRLARRLCVNCRQPMDVDEDLARLLEIPAGVPRTIYRPVGCPQCEFQGYRGRIAIIETLRLDDELDELIVRRCTQWELLRAAQRKGFRPLASAALRRVAQGDTSLEEAARVVDLTRVGAATPDAAVA
jgi:type II secretory ATPase GspE/PulE/Tfp pilus assembly ATPase PilB-like protein